MSGSTRLLIARHGQTDHNVVGRLQGQVDIPLNETGKAQAQQLARALDGMHIDRIVSSPLSRAVNTARPLADALGLGIDTDAAFIERGFGDWEGLTGAEIRERWPEKYAAWRAQEPLPEVGLEDRGDVGRRFASAARDLVADNPGSTVLVLSHGAAMRAGITGLIGLDIDTFSGIAGLGNCHRSELEPERSDAAGHLMRLVSHNVPPDFV